METIKEKIIKTMEEIAPKISEISQLEFTLKNPKVNLTNNIFDSLMSSFTDLDPRNFLIYYYHLKGGFQPFGKIFHFQKRSIEKNLSKETIAHEIMHYGQYECFPFLEEILTPEKQMFMDKKTKAYLTLIEGDARLIQEKFKGTSEKVKMPPWTMRLVGKEHYKKFLKDKNSEIYEKGKDILKKKFSGKRMEINELYKSTGEDLIKIFEIN